MQKKPFDDEMRTLADRVGMALSADIILYHGGIDRGCDFRLKNKVGALKSREYAALFLTTSGGNPDEAYRIARFLQESYKSFILFVGHYCKSAGTLISVGAGEIVLADMAELGPLDVQIAKHDELVGYVSGLTPMQALSTLREETFETFQEFFVTMLQRSGGQMSTSTAAKIATNLTVGCMSHIYRQIDPMRLGEYERAMGIAHHYGAKLDCGNLKKNALVSLISGYPSHGFVIDRREAETLFNSVRRPTADEKRLCELLDKLARFFQENHPEGNNHTVIEFIEGNAKNSPGQKMGRKSNGVPDAKSSITRASRPSGKKKANQQNAAGERSQEYVPSDSRPGTNGKSSGKAGGNRL